MSTLMHHCNREYFLCSFWAKNKLTTCSCVFRQGLHTPKNAGRIQIYKFQPCFPSVSVWPIISTHFKRSIPYIKVNLFYCMSANMHHCEDVQLYSFIYYTDMFRSLLWPSSRCRTVRTRAICDYEKMRQNFGGFFSRTCWIISVLLVFLLYDTRREYLCKGALVVFYNKIKVSTQFLSPTTYYLLFLRPGNIRYLV